MDEPVLEVDDIQGHVLVGFGGGYQRLLGLRIRDGRIGPTRDVLLRWIERVTPARQSAVARDMRRGGAALGPGPSPETLGLSFGFSAEGLAALGPFTGPSDRQFRAGAAAAAAALRDPTDAQGRPVGWVVGGSAETAPHVFVVLAGMDPGIPDRGGAELLGDLGDDVDVVYDETGRRLPGDKEHFGFADGISQPAPRGTVDGRSLIDRMYPEGHPLRDFFARPGQPLVWPGQFVFGYATHRASGEAPGPASGAGDPLLRNGSILVFRRLRQNVALFEAGMEDLARQFSVQGLAVNACTAAAWCVGRWPDGTPVSVSPSGPDGNIASDPDRRNGFSYRSRQAPVDLVKADGATVRFPGAPNDPDGERCPFFAHIRKVNPRDVPVDLGERNVTLRSQMLRRGIPYGPDWKGADDELDRGLLFMSYQTSVENQFHRLMTLWVNNPAAPPTGHGIDPVIGEPGTAGRTLARATPDLRLVQASAPDRWVVATGGGYFFVPGIAALRAILSGTTV